MPPIIITPPAGPDICPETSDGWHTLSYQDGTGKCDACGQRPEYEDAEPAEGITACTECGSPTDGQCVHCFRRVCRSCAETGHNCPGLEG